MVKGCSQTTWNGLPTPFEHSFSAKLTITKRMAQTLHAEDRIQGGIWNGSTECFEQRVLNTVTMTSQWNGQCLLSVFL